VNLYFTRFGEGTGCLEPVGNRSKAPTPFESVKKSKAPVAYARGSERKSHVQRVLPNRDREGVGMGLQLTKGDENLGEERYPR
jgi:hypothetical protein